MSSSSISPEAWLKQNVNEVTIKAENDIVTKQVTMLVTLLLFLGMTVVSEQDVSVHIFIFSIFLSSEM